MNELYKAIPQIIAEAGALVPRPVYVDGHPEIVLPYQTLARVLVEVNRSPIAGPFKTKLDELDPLRLLANGEEAKYRLGAVRPSVLGVYRESPPSRAFLLIGLESGSLEYPPVVARFVREFRQSGVAILHTLAVCHNANDLARAFLEWIVTEDNKLERNDLNVTNFTASRLYAYYGPLFMFSPSSI